MTQQMPKTLCSVLVLVPMSLFLLIGCAASRPRTHGERIQDYAKLQAAYLQKENERISRIGQPAPNPNACSLFTLDRCLF